MFPKEENANCVKCSCIAVNPESHPCEEVYSSTQIESIRSIAKQRVQTVAHLVGSLICEGDGNNLGWWYAMVQNEMCYSTCECACFSAAGSCEYLQRDFWRMDDGCSDASIDVFVGFPRVQTFKL